MKRFEDQRVLVGRDAGPVIGDAQDDFRARVLRSHLDRIRDRRELERVLEQVHECMLELRRVDAHRRRVLWQDRLHARVLRSDRLEGARDQPVDRPELWHRTGGAGLEPGEIEQVGDEPVEPLDLEPDRRVKLLALLGGQ